MDELKITPLNSWHRDAGANMADFGGFEMPLWYESGVKNEHLAVLKSAGIFDTSHMACETLKPFSRENAAMVHFWIQTVTVLMMPLCINLVIPVS